MATRTVKPLIKDYKTALNFLADRLGIELKLTKSGSLNGESVGYLKGYCRISIGSTVQELLGELLIITGQSITAVELALYFRNERDMLKDEATRQQVVQSFARAFDMVDAGGVSDVPDDETVNEPDVVTVDVAAVDCYDDYTVQDVVEESNPHTTIEPGIFVHQGMMDLIMGDPYA